MPNKILTLSDLVAFCERAHFDQFNSSDSGYQLCVAVPATFEELETSDELTLYGKVKLFHTNDNRNGSHVTKEAAEKCLPFIKYKPVLANFCEIEDENGEMVRDFTAHDMIFNQDGTTTYIERQVGCFTADAPVLEYDEEHDRYYVVVGCAIPREYTDAAEIIERKGGTKISAELFINQFSYDAQRHVVMLEDIDVSGGTLLGKNPETGEDVVEGMEGARVDIADFKANESIHRFESDPRIVELLESISTKLDAFSNINNISGKEDAMTKFEQLLEQYGKTVEDITFDYEGLSDEELEAAFSTAFDEPDTSDDEGESVGDLGVDESNDDANAGDGLEDEQPELIATEFTVTRDGMSRTFSISLNDKLAAISNLVNEAYSELDGDYYDVTVYEAEKRIDMCGLFTGKSYRQMYKVLNDCYSLVGDRVETFKQYLTADELSELEARKKRCAELEEYHDKKEFELEHNAKMSVMDAYASISDTDEYRQLVETIDQYSIDEISEKADAIVGRYARAGRQFSAIAQPAKSRRIGLDTTEQINPKSYSGLFE